MILHGKLTENDQRMTLHVDGEKITRIEPFIKRSGWDERDPHLYISSGFFDPQVNGFSGIDFNAEDLTLEDIHHAAQAISKTGVTTFFPTLITASFERYLYSLKVFKNAIEGDPLISKMCKGIHLEGPYISSFEGPRGIHPSQFIRPPQWDEFQKLQEASGGKVKLITLAPEKEGCLDFIKKAVSSGVVVAIGHSDASEEILEAAYEAGARLSTHLGNGIGDQILRSRNPFQKQLIMDGLMATIIADGIHLSGSLVKNIVRAKTPDRILLCTDAISAAAQPSGRYRLGDLDVDVGRDDRTRLAGKGSLAGSTLSVPRAITNIIKFAGIDLRTAIHMATVNGKKLFPEIVGTIAPDQSATLVLFRFDGEVRVERVFLMGEEIPLI